MKKSLCFTSICMLSLYFCSVLIAQNVGIGVAVPQAKLHVNGVLLVDGSGPAPVLGDGSRVLWIPNKSAFRVGSISTTNLDADSIGSNSFAAGINTRAKGFATIALGSDAIATGEYAVSIGFTTSAKSYAGFSIGMFNDHSDTPHPYIATAFDRIFQIGNGQDGSTRSNALTVLRYGAVGLGTVFPLNILHIREGASGAADPGFPGALIERDGNTYLTFSTPTANESGIIFGNPGHNAHGGIIYNNTVFSQDANGLQFRTNLNATRMVVYDNGNAWLQGALDQDSDERLKKDIQPIADATQRIRQISGYTYHWKAETLSPVLQTGFLAQEVQPIFPELVREHGDGHLSMNYIGMIPYLLEAIKEQQEELDQLRSELDELKKKP